MKLAPAQLDAHLNKTLAPIYLICGDEIVLKNEALQSIRRAAKSRGFTERTRLSSASVFEWDNLGALLQSTSLLGDKKIIELDFRDQTPPKTAITVLEDYAKHPHPDTLLIIELAKVDDKISRASWFKACDQAGATLTYWPLTRPELITWIKQRAQKYQLNIDANAIQLLADYVEGNLIAAQQMLEKLYLLQPADRISIDDLTPLLADESRFSVFDLMEALLNGEASRATTILKTLEEDGIEPAIILWAITRELRLLAQLSQEKRAGQSLDSLFQKHRIFSKRQPGIRRFLQKNQPDDCLRTLRDALPVDACIKGAQPGHPYEALTLLCLRLL